MSMSINLVKMSPKGQLVVPKDIREKEKFKPTDRFIAVSVAEGVLFKRIELPDMEEFESLSREVSKQLQKQSVKPKDIGKAVRWARKD